MKHPKSPSFGPYEHSLTFDHHIDMHIEKEVGIIDEILIFSTKPNGFERASKTLVKMIGP